MVGWIRKTGRQGPRIIDAEGGPDDQGGDGPWEVSAAMVEAGPVHDRPAPGEREAVEARARAASAGRIAAATEELERAFVQEVISARSAIDALLDLWAVAHELDPEAALPAERLIASLVGRNFASREELRVVGEQTRLATEFCLELADVRNLTTVPADI